MKLAGERAADLTRQLLAFGRRQLLQPVDLDLNAVIEDLMKLLRRVIGENYEVNVMPGLEIGNVHADKGQLEQVIMNLCVNARDAMPGGGTITIETRETALSAEYVEAYPWVNPGRHAVLSISDTGHGIEGEILDHIFESFFTTKMAVFLLLEEREAAVEKDSEPQSATGGTETILLAEDDRDVRDLLDS